MVLPYSKIMHVIVTQVHIGMAFIPSETPTPFPGDFHAIWDTGATKSTIKQAVAEQLQLPLIRQAKIFGVGGAYDTGVYLASLFLPNGIVIPELELIGCDNSLTCDMLIGMDIISLGDFLISNYDGKTVFSFVIPPHNGGLHLQGLLAYNGYNGKTYSHIPGAQEMPPKPGRNALCPCGSGEKYKRCCGK